MATPSKRKRRDTSNSNTSSKRLSRVRGADKPETSPGRRRKSKQSAVADPDKLWTVRTIQAERGNKYLIDWEDDPVTGESYTPTWEPKANANQEAINHWEEQKLLKATTAAPAQASTTARKAERVPSRKRHRKSKSESESASASASTTNVAADDPSFQEPPSKRARLSGSAERERDHQAQRDHHKQRSHSSGSSSRRAASEAAPVESLLAAEPPGSRSPLSSEKPQDKSEIEDSYILEELPNVAELRVPVPQISESDKSNYDQFSSAFLSSQTQQALNTPPDVAPIATYKEGLVQVIRGPQSDHCKRSLPPAFDPEGTIPDSQSAQESSDQITAPGSPNDEAINATTEETEKIVPSTSPVNSESASDRIANLSGLAGCARPSESFEVFNSPGTSPPSSSDTFTGAEEASKAVTEVKSESSDHAQLNESDESSKQASDSNFQHSEDSINRLEQGKPEEPSPLETGRNIISAIDINCQGQDTESNATLKPFTDQCSVEPATTHTAGNATLEEAGQEGYIKQQTEGTSDERVDENERLVSNPEENLAIRQESPQPAEILQPADSAETSHPVELLQAAEIHQQVEPSDPVEAFSSAESPESIELSEPVEPLQLSGAPRPTEASQPTDTPEPVEVPRQVELLEPSKTSTLVGFISQLVERSEPNKSPLPVGSSPPAGILENIELSASLGVSQPVEASEQAETSQLVEDFRSSETPQPVESLELVKNSQLEKDPLSVEAPQLTESFQLAETPQPTGYPQPLKESHPLETSNPPQVEPPQRAVSPWLLETPHPIEASCGVEISTSAETPLPTEPFPLLVEASQREIPQPIELPLPVKALPPTETSQPAEAEPPQLLEAESPHPLEAEAPQLAEAEPPQPLEAESPHPLEAEAPQLVEVEAPRPGTSPEPVETPRPVESPLPIQSPQLVDNPQPVEVLQQLEGPLPAEDFQQVKSPQAVEASQLAEISRQEEHSQSVESSQNVEPSSIFEAPQSVESPQLAESSLPIVEGFSGIPQGTDPANGEESGCYQAAQKVSQPRIVQSPATEELDSDQDIIFQTQVPLALSTEADAEERQTQSEERVPVSGHQVETQSESEESTPVRISSAHTTSYSFSKGLEADQQVNFAEGVRQRTHSEESTAAPVLPANSESQQAEEGVRADQPQNSAEDSWQAAQVVSPSTEIVSQILSNDDDTASSRLGGGDNGGIVNQQLQDTAKSPESRPIEIHRDEGGHRSSGGEQIPLPGLVPKTPSPPVHAPSEAEEIAQLVDHKDPLVPPGLAGRRISEPRHLQGNTHTHVDQGLRSPPLPFPPSHSVEGYDSSPPAQALQPSSSDSMSDGLQSSNSPPEGLSLREKLSNLRAIAAAMRARREGSMRSPRSTVSPTVATEPQAQPTETLPPSRSPPDKSPTPSKPNDLPLNKELSTQVASSIAAIDLGEMEFIVPLAMNARVRDQYQQTIYNYRKEIEAFVRTENESDAALISQMKRMLENVSNVAIHPDLDSNDIISPQGVPEEDEAKWSENCSTKFKFLRHFLEAIRHQKRHVAILAESKRLLDILELFLKANRFKFNRPDRPDNNRMELISKFPGQMTVTLQETGENGAIYVASDAHLVIAFDRTFNPHDKHVEVMRNHPFIGGKICPVFHLLIQNSVEHVDMCVPSTLGEEPRLQAVVYYVTQARQEVGVLPLGYPSPSLAAEKLAKWFLAGGDAGQWPLPPLGSIRGIERLTDSQTSDSQQNLQGVGEPPDDADDVQNGQKRPLVDENSDNLGPQKKLRPEAFSPVQNIVPGEPEVSRVSDSVAHPSPAPGLALAIANGGKGKVKEFSEETHQTTDASTGIGGPEPQLQPQIANPPQQVGSETEIRQQVQSLEKRLRDYIEDFSELQTKYENQVEDLRSLHIEHDNASAALKLAGIRRDQMTAEITKLKEERADAEAFLKKANAELMGSSRPGVADLARAREETRKETIEKLRLEQKIDSMTRELDFFRAQYQEASSEAAEVRSECQVLRDLIEILRRKASGEAMKLRQMAISTENEKQSRRILELEATLRERTEHLRRKEEEMRSQARGKGAVIRAGSTPKSPKPSRAGSPSPSIGNVPTAVVSAPATNNGGYGPGPGVGGAGRGGHPLRYSGYPLPME